MPIDTQLFSFLIPKEILIDFEIKNIEDTEELLIIELVEKLQNISKLGKDETLVNNGFMNPLELQHFPMNGKKCVLKLNKNMTEMKNYPRLREKNYLLRFEGLVGGFYQELL